MGVAFLWPHGLHGPAERLLRPVNSTGDRRRHRAALGHGPQPEGRGAEINLGLVEVVGGLPSAVAPRLEQRLLGEVLRARCGEHRVDMRVALLAAKGVLPDEEVCDDAPMEGAREGTVIEAARGEAQQRARIHLE